MCALIEWVSQDMTDPCTAPRIIVDVTFRIALYPRDRNLVIHELLCDPHTAPAVQRHVIDFSDHRRRLRVKDQMPPVIRVTHQSERRLPTTKLSLPGTGHTPRQHLFGNIPAVHIIQDILKGRDVHFLAGQAVNSVCNGDISYIVFGEKDFDIAAGLDIISAQSGQVFCDDTANLSRLNISNHTLKGRAVEVAACITVIHIILILEHPVFFGKVPEHKFLVANAHALIIAAIVQRDTAVKRCDFLIDLFFPAHSVLLL